MMTKNIQKRGLAVNALLMLLALAGSNYSYAKQNKATKPVVAIAKKATVEASEPTVQRATIVVSNPTDAQRQELVEINMTDIAFQLKATPQPGEDYIVKNKRGQIIGSQVTHDGKLLIDASVRPHGSITYYVTIGKAQPQKVWTIGALYASRKDDIAWENDRCAYRVYGPALQRSGERSFGTDIWVKNTPDTVVYERYAKNQHGWEEEQAIGKQRRPLEQQLKQLSSLDKKALTKKAKEEHKKPADLLAEIATLKSQIQQLNHKSDSVNIVSSFHLEQGNGLDPYRVGATLGLGAPALMVGDSLALPYCWKEHKILDNGPLRFTVDLVYNPSIIGTSKDVIEHRIISLDKGSNFNKMTVWYEHLNEPTDLATGVPIHEEDTKTYTLAKDYVSYADPTDEVERNNSQVYVGVLFPEGVSTTLFQPFSEKHDGAIGHALGIRKGLKDGEKYSYYFGAAWSKYDVRSYGEWQLRIQEFLEALKTPLKVSIQ